MIADTVATDVATIADVRIPTAIFDALGNGSITVEQFDIYCYCYHMADRPTYRVKSYSAANVCRFRWLDQTPANVKRYERAALDLLARNLIHRDYYRIDPRRLNKAGRTYSVWVPSLTRFDQIRTPEENALSLWPANVGLLVHDNVGLPFGGTGSKQGGYEASETDNVGLNVGLNGDLLSIKDQRTQNSREITPLNPPTGDFSPSRSPSGTHSNAVGLGNQNPKLTTTRKPLNPNQCQELKNAAVLYADFSNWLWKFTPDVDDVTSLLRQFTIQEVLFVQIEQFEPYGTHLQKNTMAHFFKKGAKALIQAARLKGTSKTEPNWFQGSEFKSMNEHPKGAYAREFQDRLNVVLSAHSKVFGEVLDVASAVLRDQGASGFYPRG